MLQLFIFGNANIRKCVFSPSNAFILPAGNMSTKKIIEQSFTVPIRHLHFHYGGVSCKKLVKELNKTVSITIINYDIREEFDAVKEYFANALGSPNIQMDVRIEVVNGVPRMLDAQSPEIAAIGGGMIETVRFQFVKDAVKKKTKVEAPQTLLTMEELFNAISDNKVDAAAFYKDEKSLADDLLLITETKHYHHLQYLSSKHAFGVLRLRFILKPFSFLFLLEGSEHYHLVWETLDTEEATYAWPVEKDEAKLKLALKKVEDVIHLVKVQGKVAYISSEEKNYRRIFHKYSEGVKGFVKWKGELESGLT